MKNHIVLFAVCGLVFVSHQVMERMLDVHIEIVDSYLDPLLFMPILLTLLTWERQYILRNRNFRLASYEIFCYFVAVSVIAEIILPKLSAQMTADLFDVLCYAIGATLFLIVNRKKSRIIGN